MKKKQQTLTVFYLNYVSRVILMEGTKKGAHTAQIFEKETRQRRKDSGIW